MLYRRSSYPEIDEIVLCKVSKIFPNSIFVDLLEYGNSGLVHISEVAPGRIRNLRDYVSEGRQIVCKVLRIDREKGHIDLSLRRVNSAQNRAKLDEIKQELKAEALVKNLAKKLQKPLPELYQQITDKVFKEYSHLYLCFKAVVDDNINLEKLGLEQNLAKELSVAVIDKFKPPKIYVRADVILQTYLPEGIEKIKATLIGIENITPHLTLSYLGAGRYRLVIEEEDYKPAEKHLEKVEELLGKFRDKLSTAVLEREKQEK